MYTLEFENATKRDGKEAVVDDLTFTIQPRQVTGFLGPNGAGKSTAMISSVVVTSPGIPLVRSAG
jgi:ABC-2 type transport system ATP-binding protein